MATDNKPDPAEDTSKPGREEEVITNSEEQSVTPDSEQITNVPLKDKMHRETEGERRFKEGIANNSDTNA